MQDIDSQIVSTLCDLPQAGANQVLRAPREVRFVPRLNKSGILFPLKVECDHCPLSIFLAKAPSRDSKAGKSQA